MSWEECVANIKATYDPKAQEVLNVNWSTIPQDNLDANTFQNNNPFALICPGRHCTESVNESPVAHRICQCKDINGQDVPNCTPKDYLYPYPGLMCVNTANPGDSSIWTKAGRNCTRLGDTYYVLSCVCCCSCFANGTLIAVPAGYKPIEDFVIGDNVLAGSLGGSPGALQLTWEPLRVGFSFGTAGGGEAGSEMVYLHYGSEGTIIVTTDHLFLLTSGRIIRANRLVPGEHELVSPTGDAVAVHEVSIGSYVGGIHHIATAPEFTGDLQQHLLSSAGVVSGDFNLQIHADELKDRVFVEGHDDLPMLGSAAYDDAHPDLGKTHTATYAAGTADAQPKPLQFYVHKPKAHRVPDDAAGYLTSEQSDDIADARLKATFDEIAVTAHKATQVLKLFRGHYPGITFKLLRGHMEINAYAYEQHDHQFVTISQGLSRLKGMDQEGLALILAHLITRLQRSAPTGTDGWTSVGMGDYYSTAIIRDVYFTQAGKVYNDGLKQVQAALFDHISAGNAEFVTDPYHPTVDKRVDALDAGWAAEYPPPDIGGPTQYGLHVVDAVVSAAQFDASSFVSRSIGSDESKAAYGALVENDILAADGTLAKPVDSETDLSFLFPDEPATDRDAMIASVRYVLMEGPETVTVSFNMEIRPSTIKPADFTFTPDANVVSTQPAASDSAVEVKAHLEADTDYTVTAHHQLLASDGSTLDPDHASAKFSTGSSSQPQS